MHAAAVQLGVCGILPRGWTALCVLTQMCEMSSVVSLFARQGIVAFPSSRRTLQEKTACTSIWCSYKMPVSFVLLGKFRQIQSFPIGWHVLQMVPHQCSEVDRIELIMAAFQ